MTSPFAFAVSNPGWKHISKSSFLAIASSSPSISSTPRPIPRNGTPSQIIFSTPAIVKTILSYAQHNWNIRIAKRVNKLCNEVLKDEEFDSALFRMNNVLEPKSKSEPKNKLLGGMYIGPVIFHPALRGILKIGKINNNYILHESAIWPPMYSLQLQYEDSIRSQYEIKAVIRDNGITVLSLMNKISMELPGWWVGKEFELGVRASCEKHGVRWFVLIRPSGKRSGMKGAVKL